MDYLKKYFSSSEMELLMNHISDEDKIQFLVNEKNVCEVLDFFQSMGFNNLIDICLYKSNLLYDSVFTIENKMKLHMELLPFLKEDVQNFDIIGL